MSELLQAASTPTANQRLIGLAHEAVRENGIVLLLDDPHQTEATPSPRAAPAGDQRFAKFCPLERSAVLDELSHAKHLSSEAQVVGRDLAVLVEPMDHVDDPHRWLNSTTTWSARYTRRDRRLSLGPR